MSKTLKRLTIFWLVLLLLSLSFNGCATTPEVVYSDLPAGYIAVKKDTLNKLVEELIITRHQLMECWERERK